MNLVLLQVANGIGVGVLYFLVAVGLSIVFGLLRLVNFSHGAFYMAGAYLSYAIVNQLGLNFWAALVAVPTIAFILAIVLERGVLQRAYKMSHTTQILLTLGLATVMQEMAIIIWGTDGLSMATPAGLDGIVQIGDFIYPRYRIFVVFVSAALALFLWLLLENTNLGAKVRAGSEYTDMMSLLGCNINNVFMFVFGLGAALAAMAGLLAAPMRGIEPFMGLDALGTAFVVVVIGGMGSFGGALVGALLIGIVQSVLSISLPELSQPAIYVVMAAVLLVRPHGLFGRA